MGKSVPPAAMGINDCLVKLNVCKHCQKGWERGAMMRGLTQSLRVGVVLTGSSPIVNITVFCS